MKKYSYLTIPHGLETYYRKVKEIDTFLGWFCGGGVWSVYGCVRGDCVESERFVGIRQYTRDRITAATMERLTAEIYSFESRI